MLLAQRQLLLAMLIVKLLLVMLFVKLLLAMLLAMLLVMLFVKLLLVKLLLGKLRIPFSTCLFNQRIRIKMLYQSQYSKKKLSVGATVYRIESPAVSVRKVSPG